MARLAARLSGRKQKIQLAAAYLGWYLAGLKRNGK